MRLPLKHRLHLIPMIDSVLLQVLLLCAALFTGSAAQNESECGTNDIIFLSFFPCINDSVTGTSVRECDVFLYPAALLAMEHVNAHHHYLKYPYLQASIQLKEAGTKGDIDFTVFFLEQSYHNLIQVPVHVILGPDSSDIAARVTYLTGQQRFQTHTMSYGATDPSLTDRKRYPLLFSTIPSEKFTNVGRLHLLRMFNWHRVGMLSSTEALYAKAAESFVQLAKNYPDMSITYYGSFGATPVFAFDEMWDADMRIILGLFSEKHARSVLCKAHRYRDGRLINVNHLWILPSYYDPQWWNASDEKLNQLPLAEQCSNDEMVDVLHSVLFVDSFNYNLQSRGTTLGMNITEFFGQLLRKTAEVFPSLREENLAPYLLHSHAATTYDAVWSMAIAWHSAIPELVFNPNFDVCNGSRNDTSISQIITEVLNASVNNITLHGVSGVHQFNKSWDSHGQIVVSQFRDGTHWPIGIYQAVDKQEDGGVEDLVLGPFLYLASILPEELNKFFAPATDFQWGTRGHEQPSDGVIVVYSSFTVYSLVVVSALTFLSLAYAITLLTLNFKWRRNKHIKASSPKLNWILIVGFMSAMPCAVPVALIHSSHSYNISQSVVDILCKMDPFGRFPGFIMALSTILVKNWRIHRIFHNSRNKELNTLSDNRLMILILIATMPIVILVTLWVATDPLKMGLLIFPKSDTSILIVTTCSSKYFDVWITLSLMYTLPFLVANMFLGLQNSKIASRFREEGKIATRAIFISMLILLLVNALVLLVTTQLQLYRNILWLSVLWLLLLPDILLTVLYIPKFIAIYKDYKERKKQKVHKEQVSKLNSQYSSLREEMSRLKHELVEKEERIRVLRAQQFVRTQDTISHDTGRQVRFASESSETPIMLHSE